MSLTVFAGFLYLTEQITDRHGWPEAHGDHGKETAGRKKLRKKLFVYWSPATLSACFSLHYEISYQWGKILS